MKGEKNQILIGGLLCAGSPFLCKKPKKTYSLIPSMNLYKTPTMYQIWVVFQMKLNQRKGFTQISTSPLHRNVLHLLSWTRISRFSFCVAGPLNLFSVCWQAKSAYAPQRVEWEGTRDAFQSQITSESGPGLDPEMDEWHQSTKETNELTHSKANTDPKQDETPVERVGRHPEHTQALCSGGALPGSS